MDFEEYYKRMCGIPSQPSTDGDRLMQRKPEHELSKKELRWLVDLMKDEISFQYNNRQTPTNVREVRRSINIIRKLKSQLEAL